MGIARLTGLQVVEGTICDAPMNPRARVVMFKRRGAQEAVMSKKVKKTEGETDPLAALEGLSDEQKAAIAQALAAKEEQIAQLRQSKAEGEGDEEKAKADDSEDDEEKEAANKAVAKARAEVVELRKALEVERTARLDREYLEKARSYASIPVPPEKVGGLMRVVAEKAADQVPVLEQVLKACSELAAESSVITKSIGRAGVGVAKAGSVAAEVEAEAGKLMSADPKMTATKARAEVWKRRPDLAKRHREETAAH